MHDIFFFTDIHGMYSLYRAVMDYCKEQDPECTIIFGGDAIDRGPDGYKIMKELLDDPQVIYLKGNHEDMFVRAAYEIKDEFSFSDKNIDHIHEKLNNAYQYKYVRDSLFNGGLSTLTDWVLDDMPMDIVERIDNLPLTFSYKDKDFCHTAGIYKCFKAVADKEYKGEKVPEWDAMYALWTRYLESDWAPKRTAIFGHTPVLLLNDYVKVPVEKLEPVAWTDVELGWTKIDMDCGSAFTDVVYVLNILTMKMQGFKSEEKI